MGGASCSTGSEQTPVHKSTNATVGVGGTANCSAVPRLPVRCNPRPCPVSQPAHLCSAGTLRVPLF